jgi:hypothetical protein
MSTNQHHNYIQLEPGNKLADLWQKAIEHCPEGGTRTTNLTLAGLFEIDEIHNLWLDQAKEKAKLWQTDPAPRSLEFSHGAYVERFTKNNGMTGVDFLVKELKEKPDTNRACWSLLSMKELVEHEQDRSIPSFMLLQAGIANDKDTLLLTAYYRALEVHKFLKINLAELCLVADGINRQFSSSFTHIALTIHAFSAYNDPEYSCLEKAEFDYEDEGLITLKVLRPATHKAEVVAWLTQKERLKESRINPRGLNELAKAINLYNNSKAAAGEPYPYPPEVSTLLEQALLQIKAHNQLRVNSSHSSAIGRSYTEIKKTLKTIIQHLNSWK